jgi:pimeloyl-ACP methyl ester carboxylesterase
MLDLQYQIQLLILLATTAYHGFVTRSENRNQSPPGQLADVGGYKLHLYTLGQGKPTVILDHSLGGIEGYFLIEEIAKLTRVCIYDRAGYGWSDSSFKPRTSAQIVQELDQLLTTAEIKPPYILVGNSFGSYNVRLYADQFPEKVAGIVLTDGLHESGMLKMSLSLQSLKLFFISGFLMSILGASLGLVRLLNLLGLFEILKPELRQFPPVALRSVKRSFLRPKHWLTMMQELWSLDKSGYQLLAAQDLGDLPIISIKASAFFKHSGWNFYMPLQAADRLRETMHAELLKLSTNCQQLSADRSDHFVWVDQPEVILKAIQLILEQSVDRKTSI